MPREKVMIVGGGVLNTAVVGLLRKRYTTVLIPEQATVFEAYGAALWALAHPCIELPQDIESVVPHSALQRAFHPPLCAFSPLVDFKASARGRVRPNDECVLGLDVGSTTTKAVLIRNADKTICADVYLRTNGNPVEASRLCYAGILKQIGTIPVSITALGVTGSGRQIAGLHGLTENIINEIIAHATAAAFYNKDVDTIFEIGGQDAKYTFLTSGVPSDYAMNEACSAGTGSFLEESAFETLRISTEDIGDYALAASKPPNFNDQCAAFISSDVKKAVQQGISHEDILAGLVYSICLNYINRVKGPRAIGRTIFMQGGVCYNRAVPIAMASILKTPIIVPPDPGLMGAYGVGLEVLQRLALGLITPKSFDLKQLSQRQAVTEGTFECAGGREKCDRKCTISRIRINNTLYPFGGACNRYYNLRVEKTVDDYDGLDLVSVRQHLLLDKYGPALVAPEKESGGKPRTVGLNSSLLFHSLYPLFSNFFARCGFTVIVPDGSDVEGNARAEAAFCQPVECAHGSFYNLLKRKCDFIFLPQIMQLPVPNVPTYSRLCPFVQGEPYYLKTTFRKEIENSGAVILNPVLRMENGYEAALKDFIALGVSLGTGEKDARNAYTYACEKQIAFEHELRRIGKKTLFNLSKDNDRVGIVLFGRPYNAFASNMNMGVTHKVASRGYMIIPFDMLSADEYTVDKKMFWAMGQKILKATRFVKVRDNLFGFYITNFSCGPDSFLLQYFRDIMGSKPSLTLELDQHTADAGIDTRIEAALDIIQRFRRIRKERIVVKKTYTPVKVKYPHVYSSTGEKIAITDPRVEVLIPSMGRYASEALAAILRNVGIHARALPVTTSEDLLTGKKYTTCKECLPYITNTGTFLNHLTKRIDPEKISILVMATGGGPCRLGQYYRSIENTIHKLRIPNAAVLTVTDENGYNGLGTGVLLRAWQAIVLTDVLSDIGSMLRVCATDRTRAMKVLDDCWRKCIACFEGKLSIRFSSLLKFVGTKLAQVPLRHNPSDIPVVSLVGEIFVRRDEFSRGVLVDFFEEHGFMVRVAPMAEYVCYSNYVVNGNLGEKKFTIRNQIKFKLLSQIQEWWEKRIKTIMASSGLCNDEMIDVASTIEGVSHLINHNFRGECILTVGLAMREILKDSCGVVSIGPFGCMYSRMAEAMLKKEMDAVGKGRMPGWNKKAADYQTIGQFPFLSIETDGNAFPQHIEAGLDAFIVQARRLHEHITLLDGGNIQKSGDSSVNVLLQR